MMENEMRPIWESLGYHNCGDPWLSSTPATSESVASDKIPGGGHCAGRCARAQATRTLSSMPEDTAVCRAGQRRHAVAEGGYQASTAIPSS